MHLARVGSSLPSVRVSSCVSSSGSVSTMSPPPSQLRKKGRRGVVFGSRKMMVGWCLSLLKWFLFRWHTVFFSGRDVCSRQHFGMTSMLHLCLKETEIEDGFCWRRHWEPCAFLETICQASMFDMATSAQKTKGRSKGMKKGKSSKASKASKSVKKAEPFPDKAGDSFLPFQGACASTDRTGQVWRFTVSLGDSLG